MFMQQLPYLLVYFIALVLSAVVFYYAWKNRSGKGIRFFAWSVLLEISWLIGYLFELNSPSIGSKIFWDNFAYIGALLAPVFLLGFAIEYTEIKLNTRRLLFFLSGIAVLSVAAIYIFSYVSPDLVRTNAQIESGLPFNELNYDFGTLSFWANVYLLMLAFVSLAMLTAGLFRKISISRLQVAVVLAGMLIPIVGLTLGLIFGWEFANQSDISPLMFALSNAVIAFGIFRFRLFNVIPVARQALFDTIDDLLIVLDHEDRIVDVNPAARKAFGWNTGFKDMHIGTLLPNLYAQFQDTAETRTEFQQQDGTYYELKINQISDRSGDHVGRLIYAHDITLQKKVEQDLQKTNAQNKQRAAQFQAIAQVASSISSVQELQKTLTQITTTLSLQLGHYHVGIFLIDSTHQFAILQAASSDGGRSMLDQGYRLRIGETGVVSAAITTTRPQLALDVDTSKIFHANPFLPDTRSEVALPIRLSGELIGVLDIQSLQHNAFSIEDLEVFEILASQVGIAIQNARLYEQNVQALKDIEDAYSRLSGSTWSHLLQQMDIKAFAYDGVSSRPLSETHPGNKSAALSVPVVVRGQVVGHLRLSALDPGRTWTDDDIAITRAVAERAALALEAARLLEDAQKRASRETFLSEMASKLSASFQLDSILRDTVEELGQSLSGSTVSFQLIDPASSSTAEKSNGRKKGAA